jgi:hypothetical protein
MENQDSRDNFLRELFQKKEKEKPSAGFTSSVMERVRLEATRQAGPLLKPGTWVLMSMGFVLFVVLIFTVNIPFVNSLFSATGMEKISLNIFSSQFISSFQAFFKEIHLTSISVMIGIAAVLLVGLDRILRHGQPSSKMLIC